MRYSSAKFLGTIRDTETAAQSWAQSHAPRFDIEPRADFIQIEYKYK